ncbi:MAG: Elongation factor P--(R)-beta-lysine ligase [Chlamydiae bacterium]|nr:Elongation factor P--(R)-beta-lysine ligase [Chlamydiota bacterium]
MLAAVRKFFVVRQVMEVDTPILASAAPINPHIEVMEVRMGAGAIGYLHTSPEYALKRLLAEGSGDIYQLSHVFRSGEKGRRHAPEFTMLEWYRHNLDFDALIDEAVSLVSLFLGDILTERYTFREAFNQLIGFDYLGASEEKLQNAATSAGLDISPHWDRNELITLLFSEVAEAKFQTHVLTIISDFPAFTAALSKVVQRGDEPIARRFEMYARGVELANGYDELTDGKEQRRRFEEHNKERLLFGKKVLPIDEDLLSALDRGMPDCRGVAIGFDRLLMLRLGADHIEQILPLVTT